MKCSPTKHDSDVNMLETLQWRVKKESYQTDIISSMGGERVLPSLVDILHFTYKRLNFVNVF